MKTKVFTEDAIQRIASGVEPTQTKISLDVLENVLNSYEMRNVLGGSGNVTCHCLCYDSWGDLYDFWATCEGTKEECESWHCAGVNCHSPNCM